MLDIKLFIKYTNIIITNNNNYSGKVRDDSSMRCIFSDFIEKGPHIVQRGKTWEGGWSPTG